MKRNRLRKSLQVPENHLRLLAQNSYSVKYTDFGTSPASSPAQKLQLRLKTGSKGKPNIQKEYVIDYFSMIF